MILYGFTKKGAFYKAQSKKTRKKSRAKIVTMTVMNRDGSTRVVCIDSVTKRFVRCPRRTYDRWDMPD